MTKSLFIVIDGIDGSGKGEIIKHLQNDFFDKSKSNLVLTTREPTSSHFGKQIRKMLKESKNPNADNDKLLDLYTKDREWHLTNIIEPFLKQKEITPIVLSDRYYYSTIVYQHAQGIPLEVVIKVNKVFRKPDITFILDLPAKVALKRIKAARSSLEKFEQEEFLEKVRRLFKQLPYHLEDNIKIIDATKSIEEVYTSIKKEIEQLL
ncbi:MAG: dTMP kinase [Nanoarchaeota archaeon]|nr:dTMP kinase [Nanoarchaeota archaeon]